ncbi:MAG TPA: hypothetical protein VGO40_07530 [Longimicrobium sp.]|jgi:hypothetical protein|nr:hypothetical protein [Longimicrobium sp.]
MPQKLNRTAPTNYLLTAVAGALLWTALAVGLGGYLGDEVSLQVLTTEQFLALYRMALGIVLVLTLVNCFYWYYQGSRPKAAVNLAGARRLWDVSLLVQTLLAIAGLVVLVILLQTEGLSIGNFALIFGALALLTVGLFWIATLFASPPAVEYIPRGKR